MWQAVILQLLVGVIYVSGQVVSPPAITQFLEKDLVRPEEVKFNQPVGFKLPCKATGSNLEWTWKHNNTDITLPSSFYKISSDGTLTGEYLRSMHSGTYQCFVKDAVSRAATFSRKLKVLVTAVYDFTNERDEVKTVNLGQPFSLPCPAHTPGFGIVYKWESRDRENVFDRSPSRGITEDGTLYIMFMTADDIKQIEDYKGIKCVISAANVFYSSGVFEVRKPDASQIDPGTPSSPSWEVKLKQDETAVQGLTKTLYCLASGRPAPSIIWKKNDQKITSKQQTDLGISLSFQDRLLTIDNVDKSKHQDTYTCEAENTQNSGSPITTRTQLRVLVPPHWVGKPPASTITINIYGNSTLVCDADGDPLPTFQWYKNGALLNSGERLTISGKTLQFKDVLLDDDGVYQCVAENDHGMIVSSTWVNVLAKKPSFTDTGFGPFYLFKESEGILKCQPDAAPAPEFRWFKGDKEILSGDRYKILNDGTLEIDKVIASDQGPYTCKARNFLGEDSETASASVLERTRITIGPKNRIVTEGTNVDLRCEATKDKSLELGYLWKKDNRVIKYDSKMQWLEGQHVLKISDIQVDDGGIYTCVAYTPDPKRSEDTASAIVNIKGVPFPPSNLQITDCYNRTTNLSWIPGASNDAPITHFLVEQESQYEPFVFRFLYNVTDPNVKMVSLKLTAWATLRFRMRAVNSLGPSRPSLSTAQGICKTSVGPPDKWPDNFRGVPKKAEELDIAWTPMPKIDQNAPKFYYMLTYRKYQPNNPLGWNREKISDPTAGVFPVPNPGYYEEWEFKIYAGNSEGDGPESPITRSFSGQDKPGGRPENIEVLQITARSVDLRWKPVTVARGSVDGYKIYYWGQSLVNSRRRRRAIPGYASVATVLGKSEATVKGLSPFTKYTLAIKAFNSGGEGPSSDETTFETPDAPPGPPAEVEVFPFGEYILVQWQPPLEPNGVTTKYQVGSAKYTTDPKNVDVPMASVEGNVFQKLLGEREYETNYVVKIEAGNRKGWGDSVIQTTKTVAKSPPAKPERPTVVGTAVDKVNVTYNFGLGGGWTHEFKVLYRKKLEGETYASTSMVDHFKLQWVEIGNLENELYQFKTVGKNDNGESIESGITEARPLPGVVNAGQRAATPIHKSAWFITLLILIAVLLLILLIFVLYTRYRGAKYPVGKRERKRAALIDNKPYDEEEGPFDRGEDNPPPYPSQGSLDKPGQDSDRDSMDEYGEGPQFKEDGSFVEEYGDDKKAPPDEKDQSAFATFV